MNEKEFKEEFYKKASKVKTKEDLNAFLDEITAYNHDYGTIVYGLMAGMIAAFNYIDRGPQGGITGFQAGCIMWECIREFGMFGADSRLKIIDNSDMLFPQMAHKFRQSINSETWSFLQKKAHENLQKNARNSAPAVISHWESIARGVIPFGFVVSD